MSSDSELEPTPPKRRRHTQLMSNNIDSASPEVATLRSARTNKHGGENEDVFVLSDIEIDAASPRGSTSCGTNRNSEGPSNATLPLDKLPKTSKRSSESIQNVTKEETAGSSTGIESDANESEAEKCPICWLPFTNQEVANPSTCDHRFCFHCIMEWSKTTNTCPVDRQAFNDINVRPKFGSNVTRLVPVETRVSTDMDPETEDAEIDSDYDDFSFGDDMELFNSVNETAVFSDRAFPGEEAEDDESFDMYSSSNDNYTNPEVVLVSSSDEEVHLSSPSEYNELSSSSSPNNEPYLTPTSSISTCSSPSRSSSPLRVPLSSSSSPLISPSSSLLPSPSSSPLPSPSSSPLPSPSSSPLPSPSSSPLPSPSSSPLSSPSSSPLPSPSSSPSHSHSPSLSPSPSISSSLSRSHSPLLSSPSLTVSFSRSRSCSSLSNASSASISSSS